MGCVRVLQMATGGERGRGEAQDTAGDEPRGRAGQRAEAQGAVMASNQPPVMNSNSISRGRKEAEGTGLARGGHKGKEAGGSGSGGGGGEKERRKRGEVGNSFRIEQVRKGWVGGDQ